MVSSLNLRVARDEASRNEDIDANKLCSNLPRPYFWGNRSPRSKRLKSHLSGVPPIARLRGQNLTSTQVDDWL